MFFLCLMSDNVFHGTTILCVRDEKSVVMIGDGQMSLGNTVMKTNVKKIKKLGPKNGQEKVICGFAGSTADALTLFDKLNAKLEEYSFDLQRSCVELAKYWRSDKFMRKLEAMMIVADVKHTFVLTGNGDVLDPESGVVAIGSGGLYALSSANVLMQAKQDGLIGISVEEIARRSMKVAGDICVFTNHNVLVEQLTIS